jgi:sugar phosphate permease
MPPSSQATPITSAFRYRWIVLACCVLAYAASHLARWSYTGLASYISTDLHLDKAALGLLGSAFFYPYAFAQVPWGHLTDRFGGRAVIAAGLVGVAVLLACFAAAQSLTEAIMWRMALGIVTACCFTPIAGLLAQWFAPRERGLANGVYHGLGGGLGESAAFLLMPILGLYFLQPDPAGEANWRGATLFMAGLICSLGGVCWLVLRSKPPASVSQPVPESQAQRAPLPRSPLASPRALLTDPALWLLGIHFAAGIVALRMVTGWFTIYVTDVYRVQWGSAQATAVISAGVIGTIYAIGHIAGSPLIGTLSDRLLPRGLSRPRVAIGWMAVSLVGFLLLTRPVSSPVWLGLLAMGLGFALQTFPLVNAAPANAGEQTSPDKRWDGSIWSGNWPAPWHCPSADTWACKSPGKPVTP